MTTMTTSRHTVTITAVLLLRRLHAIIIMTVITALIMAAPVRDPDPGPVRGDITVPIMTDLADMEALMEPDPGPDRDPVPAVIRECALADMEVPAADPDLDPGRLPADTLAADVMMDPAVITAADRDRQEAMTAAITVSVAESAAVAVHSRVTVITDMLQA